jgi:myo-inositol-1(or 4)-monophosphatase
MDRTYDGRDSGVSPQNTLELVRKQVTEIAPELLPALDAVGSVTEKFKAGVGKAEGVRAKSHGDFQSALDVELDRLICTHLKSVTPQIPVLSEESGGTTPSRLGKHWVVDPIDGTSAYLHGTHPQHPSIMVALLDGGEPVASLVTFPLTDEWFYAAKGRGAFKNTKRCSVADSTLKLREARVIMNQYGDAAQDSELFSYFWHTLRRPQGIPASLVTVEAPHSGAACRLVDPDNRSLGAVVHDNNATSPKQKIWDLAAPRLIVEEAGGFFTDSRGRRYPLDGTSMIFVARTKEILSQLVKASTVFAVLKAQFPRGTSSGDSGTQYEVKN